MQKKDYILLDKKINKSCTGSERMSMELRISVNHVLDIVRQRKPEENIIPDSMDRKVVRDLYCMNPFGGFRIEWLKNYIVDYIL